MTDESKVSQILRNFISNALKFTEQGEVRVAARLSDDGDSVVFSVTDTGIGIAAEDQERIFEEFTQLDNYLQRRVQGHRPRPAADAAARAAARRDGVWLESEPGVGSTFLRVGGPHLPPGRGGASRRSPPRRGAEWEADPLAAARPDRRGRARR